jgi:UDPglucose--hexose-1-phosphate uridylyltransferase
VSSHRRLNPLTGDWVLVSPHRLSRPWQGRTEPLETPAAPTYDPGCYLCPGNARAGAARNPEYERTFVFDNDFPALTIEGDYSVTADDPLIVSHPERGICRVVCFSPRHNATIPALSLAEMREVVDVWTEQYRELGAIPWITHVQIFENRGASMGASNPHPHCQIWANAEMPDLPRKEYLSQVTYAQARGNCLLCDYLATERRREERIVCANDSFTALVPFWAVWPYETLLLPNRHITALDELDDREKTAMAELIQDLVRRYDRLFETECPYSMGFHQRPTDGAAHDAFHLHAHYYPPVLRSAAVHKFMVGYELLATPQRDVTPELAAAALREVQ